MDNLQRMKELFLNEIPDFKKECIKLLNGDSSKMEYKGISGGYGVYAQRDQKSFMIRLRFSSGVIKKSQLQKVYELAKSHNLDGIHFTTRQAIQLHDLDVDGLCDIMEEGIKNNIFTRGAGGNFPRNVGLSPLSGVDPNEAFDVTPYAVATDKYFMSKITTYHLPRKLKVSYSSCPLDEAHTTVQDLGFLAVLKDNKPYFKVFVGGGLGKNPAVALELDELIDLLKEKGENVIFTGDAVNKHKDYLLEHLPKAVFAPNHLSIIRASSLGELGIKMLLNNECGDLNSSPFYLKKPQAQRELEKRLALKNENNL